MGVPICANGESRMGVPICGAVHPEYCFWYALRGEISGVGEGLSGT